MISTSITVTAQEAALAAYNEVILVRQSRVAEQRKTWTVKQERMKWHSWRSKRHTIR